jgi:hypothetical protein
MGSHSSPTVRRLRDANLSRRIQANRGHTLRVSTHHRSSRTVSPARTGNRGNGLRNRQP